MKYLSLAIILLCVLALVAIVILWKSSAKQSREIEILKTEERIRTIVLMLREPSTLVRRHELNRELLDENAKLYELRARR
jgi:hypothetical protein